MRVQKLLELLVKQLNAPLGLLVRVGENGLPLRLGGVDDLLGLGLSLGNDALGVALLLPEAVQILRGSLVGRLKNAAQLQRRLRQCAGGGDGDLAPLQFFLGRRQILLHAVEFFALGNQHFQQLRAV